ncbi:VIT1/CCC1 transporter family protein [Cerasicoccus fimbriatus]|uniref:VIT1/CCC1 transporter family protein n=1 Tax=Cerasicoccus fimbriatus TaxID=3014554 RepID=UPI0022B3116C|nr:VIT family protein [Cerasicoccus sp. TK19100]
MPSPEMHRSDRIGWLRAAVLGANDGILSTASIVVGVASANSSREAILVAGLAAMVAGAMSMAAGEYVSVFSQADTEQADLELEKRELAIHPAEEMSELAQIYEKRGLDKELAMKVARQLMAKDALGAHARDELGITDLATARPLQAAFSSAAAFAAGALAPLLTAFIAQGQALVWVVSVVSLISLAMLGGIAAKAGGAPVGRAALRVTFWGALAMIVTGVIGHWFGVSG